MDQDSGQAAGEVRREHKWVPWVVGAVAVIVVLNLAVDNPPPDAVQDPAAAPAFADAPEQIGPGKHFSAVAADGATPQSLERASRELCAAERWCQVMVWTDESNRARAMPMLARESAAVAFSYRMDRSSGAEQVVWDCQRWEGAPESCMS